jgi:hypothetical protein
MGIGDLISQLAGQRRYGFDLERAVYLTVLHRLFASGRDRAAEAWKENYCIPGAQELALQHLYRAMAWLGGSEAVAARHLLQQAAGRFRNLVPDAGIAENGRSLFMIVSLREPQPLNDKAGQCNWNVASGGRRHPACFYGGKRSQGLAVQKPHCV